ncbi:MAG: ABC transporter permease [Eubacterium sp.]|nr:ABC transporter permease [Eubacterium sp.]
MTKFKQLSTTSKIVILIMLVDIILLIAAAILNGLRISDSKLIYSQLAAERWQTGDTKYSQISIFTDSKNTFYKTDIESMRSQINKKLYDDNFITEDSSSRAWIDAYSGQTEASLRKDQSSLNVNVYAVGGDYFLIHPLKLKAGSYPDLTSPDSNQILLDEYVAWNLFGGSNLAGMKLWIGDDIYTVTGVVKVEDDDPTRQAYGNKNSVYIPIEAFLKSKRNDSFQSEEEKNVAINCYEAVLPNRVQNYALNTVAEAAGIQFESDEEKAKKKSQLIFEGREIVENTGRYNAVSLIKNNKSREYVDMKTSDIVYPYWENVARTEQVSQYKRLKVCIALLVLPFLSFIALLIWLYMKRNILKKPFALLKNKIDNKIEEHKEKRYEKMLAMKEADDSEMVEGLDAEEE